MLIVSPNPIDEGMGETIATITVATKGDQRTPRQGHYSPNHFRWHGHLGGRLYGDWTRRLTFAESDFTQIDLDGNTRYRAIKTADISIMQDSVDEDR